MHLCPARTRLPLCCETSDAPGSWAPAFHRRGVQTDAKSDTHTHAPQVNHEDRFSAAFRSEHKTAPEKVPWTAGIVAPVAAAASGGAAATTAAKAVPAA